MKKILLIILTLVVVAGLVCAGIYFLGGPKFEVTNDQIENRVLCNRIENRAHSICMEKIGEYSYDKQPEEFKEVKKQIETDLAVCSINEKKEILVTKEQAKESVDASFKSLKTSDSQNHYKEALFAALKELDISEEEYLELMYEATYYKANNSVLKTHFQGTEYEETKRASFDKQFSRYIRKNCR